MKKTSDAVRETIVQWLKVKENFQMITGSAASNSSVISGQKFTRKDAHAKLAQFVNRKHDTSFTGIEMKNRYDWMLKQFKKAHEKFNMNNDIDPKELEKSCPFYKDLYELFGNRQNVDPYSVVEPIRIPERSDANDDENVISSSLESVHLNDEPQNGDQSKKRKNDDDELPEESPTKKKQATPKRKETSSEEKESPFNSKTNSSGKNGKQDFTSSFISSQKEKWKMDKEFKDEELKLLKEKFDKEIEMKQHETEIKREETEIQKKKIESEIDLRKEELQLKKMEFEANIKLREKELELQGTIKKEEVRQAQIQFLKEMMLQGKSKDDIKELLDMLK